VVVDGEVQKAVVAASPLLSSLQRFLPSSLSSVMSPSTTTLPSLRSVAKAAFGGAQLLLGSGQIVSGGPSVTCSNPQLSCHNTTAVTDTCCFNSPGGQLLLTQFWDTAPATGPVDSWTLHGLWYVCSLSFSMFQQCIFVLTDSTGQTIAMALMTPTVIPRVPILTSLPLLAVLERQSCCPTCQRTGRITRATTSRFGAMNGTSTGRA